MGHVPSGVCPKIFLAELWEKGRADAVSLGFCVFAGNVTSKVSSLPAGSVVIESVRQGSGWVIDLLRLTVVKNMVG